MKKVERNNNSHVTPKQLFEYFTKSAKIEQQKLDNQKKVMKEQLEKVTKGKNIVISNFTKSDTSNLICR